MILFTKCMTTLALLDGHCLSPAILKFTTTSAFKSYGLLWGGDSNVFNYEKTNLFLDQTYLSNIRRAAVPN